MTTTTTSRRDGVNSGAAIKVACKFTTTGNITLSALSTQANGDWPSTLTALDRIFVKDQTDGTANGIYEASTGTWARAKDFDTNRDIAEGTLITVSRGSTLNDSMWRLTNTDTSIVIGTTSLTFERAVVNDSSSISFTQAGTGAVTRTAQAKMRDTVNVLDFIDTSQHAYILAHNIASQNKTLVTTGMSAAFAASNTRHLPSGTIAVNAVINDPFVESYIFGEGMEKSIIDYTASTAACIKSTQVGSAFRPHWRDFRITGATTSGRGIDVGGNGAVPTTSGSPGVNDIHMYEAHLENIFIIAGTECLYAPFEFNCTYVNVQTSSFTRHNWVTQGGNTVTWTGCYAHAVPTGYVAWRTANGGVFISCNGLDSGGGDWGLFGSNVSAGVGSDVFNYNAQYHVNLLRCNVEDFSDIGIRYLYDGSFTDDNTTYSAKANEAYTCEVQVDLNQLTGVFINPVVTPGSGSTRSKLAAWYTLGGTNLIFFSGTAQSVDNNGTLTVSASIATGVSAFGIRGLTVNNLNMGRGWGFYSPAITTWTANATAFSVASLDRVKTANSSATNLDQATGGVDGQELTIHVRDANTTIRHNQGGAGRFLLRTGNNIAAQNGRAYHFESDGTLWWEIGHFQPTGTATLSSGTATVTLASAEPNNSYFLQLTGGSSTANQLWATAKTTAGFTINSATTSSTAVVDWLLVR